MSYSIKQIGEIIASPQILIKKNATINHLIIDSRNNPPSKNTLFFAISGKRHNGHDYIKDLYRRDVFNFVVEASHLLPENAIQKFPEANFIFVKNTTEALQKLAKAHRRKFTYPLVAITGSNGKTIIKEWLFQLLQKDLKIIRSPKSYNSQVGVPLSIWLMSTRHQLAIIEAGISQPDEMTKLEEIISPTIGIITNLNDAHQENFASYKQKIQEKLQLFSSSKIIYSPKDNQYIQQELSTNPIFQSKKIYTWSFKQTADLQITDIFYQTNHSIINGIFNEKKLTLKLNFKDKASIENSVLLWLYMLTNNYKNEAINHRFQWIKPIHMRMEFGKGINNCTIISDSYNSDLKSLEIALNYLNQHNEHRKKTIIVSDILETSTNENRLYKQMAKLIGQNRINRVIGIGKTISKFRHYYKQIEQTDFYENTDNFIKNNLSQKFDNETILLKGAREFKFEQIAQYLQKKVHRTVLEINMSAIVHNLNYFRSLIPSTTKLMVMVKAFSYGSGTYEIANLLQHQRVDYLGVAFIDEGIALRKAGINLPIMVMNPEAENFSLMIDYHLEPEIYNFNLWDLFHAELERENLEMYPVHLKIETGMKRLGFEEHEIDRLSAKILKTKRIYIKSIFSHLAGADSNEFDDFTHNQVKKYNRIADKITAPLSYSILCHILNSAGIERFPQYAMNMVRLGIGLYGVSAVLPEKLRHISTLKTYISQIRTVTPNDTIGYSRKGKVNKSSRIATIAIGYADGFNRRLSNGHGKVLINEKFAPIVGTICMDMCMVDISENENAKEGDEVIIFGKDYPITEIARQLETIPYEIMTGISARVKKVYYQEL